MNRLLLALLLPAGLLAQSAIVIETPMDPPEWALLERALLEANSDAVEAFAAKYVDSRGYLLHTPRWGTLDGPDDAVETYFNWTLLYALGGADSALKLYDKGLDGHLLQYGEMRTKLTELARNGAYHREFITQSDWFHTGEGMRGFMLYGLAAPYNPLYQERMKRFAEMYMGHDPNLPEQNYDPEKKLIKSIWTGSMGPMLHKATTYDWVGDPTPGTFHLLHNSAGRGEMLDLMSWYPKMLAHCQDYLDSVGDNPLNLGATLLGFNAYAFSGENKYRQWVLEYVDAWAERIAKAGGMIPTNVGLDGEPGGEYNGQWWKGTYGWNFTIYDGEIEQVASRNTYSSGPYAGFGVAYLLTGDRKYVDVLRKQIDILYDNKKVEGGKTLLPTMYGDPKGYKSNGKPEFYQYSPNLHESELTQIYLWSMDRNDLARLDTKKGWIGFLEGNNPNFPVEALRRDLASVRGKVEEARHDPTSPDTRLADYLLGLSPAATDNLTQLTLGGYFGNSKLWALHARLRYFDPSRGRPGLPKDVGALVEKLTSDSVTVQLVNLDPVESREVLVQAGGYGEHVFIGATVGGRRRAVQGNTLRVHLAPGAGAKVELAMERYVRRPDLTLPAGIVPRQ
ncbi:MAG: hypothetical protein GC160_08385 [Acidobacteria bacterium]|nr:hypothetical protein [Acidobacteriota bacterium]